MMEKMMSSVMKPEDMPRMMDSMFKGGASRQR
jgi:hypothetical protein